MPKNEIFSDVGYTIAFNYPFANALAPIGYHGHSVMIEVNKCTYMNEVETKKTERLGRLKKTIKRLYQDLLTSSAISDPGFEGQ